MKAKIELWTVKDLYSLKDEINEQPRYQRGSVWPDSKKSLLIDSMLRGIDMPKIFLHKKDKGAYKYEVADGQQRITSIFKFKDNVLKLRDDSILGLDLNKIGRFKVGGKKYEDLQTVLKDQFNEYLLTIAVLEDTSSDEVRTLFGRLQLGEQLKPAEKRNAILCKVGNDINTIALNHAFFLNARIPKERYNHQDYLAHAFTLVAYNNSADLKAELIQRMYLDKELEWNMSTLQKIDKVLDVMDEINKRSKKKIEKKFAFLDIFWFLYKSYKKLFYVDFDGFAKKYDSFEENRKLNYKEPEKLLQGKSKNKDLYDYIMAFRFEGLRAINYEKRNIIITKEFEQFLSK